MTSVANLIPMRGRLQAPFLFFVKSGRKGACNWRAYLLPMVTGQNPKSGPCRPKEGHKKWRGFPRLFKKVSLHPVHHGTGTAYQNLCEVSILRHFVGFVIARWHHSDAVRMPIDFRSQFAAVCVGHGALLPPSAAHFALPCWIHHARVALCADGLGCAAGNTQPIDSRVRTRRFDGNVCRLFRVKTYPAAGRAVGTAPGRSCVAHRPPVGIKELPFFRQSENTMSRHIYPTFWP